MKLETSLINGGRKEITSIISLKIYCQFYFQVRTEMRSMVKRLLKKYKYPPEGQEEALNAFIAQCGMWADGKWRSKK